MPGDRVALRVARIRKWHELIEQHGSELEAWYAIKATPEWEMTFELYPFGMLDEGRRGLVLDLMIAADKEAALSVDARSDRSGGHPGGARHKLWPRLALEEATRMWVTGAYERSRNEIAKQVTKKVAADWDADDLVGHGWDRKPFKFGRPAMDLVVDAIDAGLLGWDAKKGLGVFRKFSATPEWLPIPRRKPAF
jgi:hypothetical protein